MRRAAIFGTLGWLLLAGAILLMFFVVLSGVTDTTPLRQTYFLRADTGGIQGARNVTQWTYFYVCGRDNRDCGKPVPALPFGYAWQGGGDGAPDALRGSHGKHTTSTHYYYLWRFGWVFYLMGLTLASLGFISGCLYCVRLLNKFTGLILAFALFWYTLGVTLMTIEFVQARNRFKDAGMSASLGHYAFAFSWAAWASLLLAVLFFFIAGSRGRDGYSSRKEKRVSHASTLNGAAPVAATGRRGETTRGRFNYVPFYKSRRHAMADEDLPPSAMDKETA